MENTNSADWVLAKEKCTPFLDRNRVGGLDVFTLKYLPNSPCYGRTRDTRNACYFSVAHYRSGFWSLTVHPQGFWEVSLSPGAQLARYSQWRSSQYSYWSPRSFLSEFDTDPWRDDFSPHCTE